MANTEINHDGLYLRQRLLNEGWSEGMIRHRVRAGKWHWLGSGTYIDISTLNDEVIFQSALALGGEGAAISHESAAALHKFDSTKGWPKTIVVSTHPGVKRATFTLHDRTIRFVRRRVDFETSEVQGVRVTTRAQTMVDIAAPLDRIELERVIESFLRGANPKRPHDWRVDEFHRALELCNLHPRVPGASSLRKALAKRGMRYPTGSIAETAAFQIVCEIPGIGRVVCQVHVITTDPNSGEFEHYLDILLVDLERNLEIDGEAHRTPGQHASDLARDRRIGRGFTVLRFSASEALFKPDVLRNTIIEEIRRHEMDQARGMVRSRDWVVTGSDYEWRIEPRR